jgi:hypothetical protein
MPKRRIFVIGLSLLLLVPLDGLGNTLAQNNTNGTLTGRNITNSNGSNITRTNPTGSSNPPGMSQGQKKETRVLSSLPERKLVIMHCQKSNKIGTKIGNKQV